MVPNEVYHWEDVLEGNHVLETGYVGPAAVKLQHKLTRAGYDLDLTGIFGPNTERAIRDFQAKRNIPVTGRLGARTARALDEFDSTRWETILEGNATLKLGDDNPAVRMLQNLLAQSGHSVEKTGVFGPTTRNRVLEFQRIAGLSPSGEVDHHTARKLANREGNKQTFITPDGDAIGLVRRGNHLLKPEVADAFDRMIRTARADGVEITLLDGYRDVRRQREVFDQTPPHAVGLCTQNPGHNDHGTGRALDLDDGRKYRWLRRNARLFGFSAPSKAEPWHWQYNR